MAKKISAYDRRFQDALRRRGVQVANIYARKLQVERTKEVNRVLDILKNNVEYRMWRMQVDSLLEEKYLPNWYKGLIVNTGRPVVLSTTRRILGDSRATVDHAAFERQLIDFAERRAGSQITSVTGTLKDTVKAVIAKTIEEDVNVSVEALTKAIHKEVGELMRWQVRRIAQTEMMIGLGEAASEASTALGIEQTKTWCTSGLTNTRDTHLALDGTTVEIDEYFVLPDCEMLYPHDPNGTAEEVINCACTCIYRPKE